MLRPLPRVGLSEAQDRKNNITISESVLCYNPPPPLQLRNMSLQQKFMCECEVCISDNITHASKIY